MMQGFVNFWRRLFGAAPAECTTAREDERRVWVRHPSSAAAVVKPVNNGVNSRYSAQVRDVSRGGIKLVVDHPVEAGAMIGVDLPGATQEGASTVLACVVHATKLAENEWSLGCEFSDELADGELEAFGARKKRPSKADDNRAWVRFPCNTRASCQRIDNNESTPWPATVTNISASGIGLVVDRSVDTGSLLSLDLESPTGNSARTILAAVVHVTTRSGKEWSLGCNFIRELEPADLQALT
jgi:c-di-GMP-binding flagellar brake protein YcgR